MSLLKTFNYKLYLKGIQLLKNRFFFFPLLNFSWILSPKFNMGLRKKIPRQKIQGSSLWNFMGQAIPANSSKFQLLLPKQPLIPAGLRDVCTCSGGNLKLKVLTSISLFLGKMSCGEEKMKKSVKVSQRMK